jgi:hypothetical protein
MEKKDQVWRYWATHNYLWDRILEVKELHAHTHIQSKNKKVIGQKISWVHVGVGVIYSSQKPEFEWSCNSQGI